MTSLMDFVKTLLKIGSEHGNLPVLLRDGTALTDSLNVAVERADGFPQYPYLILCPKMEERKPA